MARALRVAMAQVNPTVGDLEGNARLVRTWLARAEGAAADLVLFPELALTGYPPEDLVLRGAFVDEVERILGGLARDVGATAAVVGFVERDPDSPDGDRAAGGAGRPRLYNAAAVLHEGRIRGVCRKVALPNYGVFDEVRTFTPGGRPPLFEFRGVRVGVAICEDAWVPRGPVWRLRRDGADVIAVINASPYHMGKGPEREAIFRDRAREAGVPVLACHTVGGQDGLIFDGGSLAVDAGGSNLAHGPSFEEELVLVDLSLPASPTRAARRSDLVIVSRRSRSALSRPPIPPAAHRLPDRLEEVYGGLALGTRDYVGKNGFEGAVVGLSGGIDSSLTAVIAADALGSERVVGAAMPGPFSSPASLEDAKALAGNLGIELVVIPIAGPYEAFLTALEETFAGRPRDVTEENLQARIRGTLLMAYSNKFGHLVLTTGNKSELATGYSTLYGDMAGGFGVLADVPKTLVYELSRWRNARGPAVIPERVLTKPPSAELRPDQRDTDSLPPYEILDPIIAAYVEENRSVGEIVEMGFDAATVRRVAAMVDRSEYKRRQAAPGIKITPRAFGKDRRLPITNRYREWEAP